MEKLEKFRGAKNIFVVGIGGSDLASKAVWSAETLHKVGVEKKVFFLESPDSREYEEVASFVNNEIAVPEDVVLIAISKSGKTGETLDAFHKIFDILSEKFGKPIHNRVIVISTPHTPLAKFAEEKDMELLEWEGDIGGRWSAFTVAHTTVLSLAGLDTNRFLEGKEDFDKTEADKLAEEIFENYGKGKDILDIFLFNNELEDLGKWCRQLIAESLGKESADGKKVGITPTVSIGPTDLHSMLQLDLGGPQTRFTLFIRAKKELDGSINESAYENTTKAYASQDLPFCKYEIEEINEYEIGRFMAFMMDMVVQLAKLLEVNPYDQPAVENYKNDIKNHD